MSTIKSSSEDLTLNADGSNEVKFQINAVEKASINSSGLLTSTNIDATVLTGNLPAISGASLTSLNASNLGSGTVADARLGTVSVSKGGTGATTHTANNVLVGNGTSAIGSVAPSTSGNVLTSNGSSWASTAPAGGGKVLQVIHASKYSTTSTTSTAWATISGFSATITPSATSSKVLILMSGMMGNSGNGQGHLRLFRGPVLINVGDTSGSRSTGFYGSRDWVGGGNYATPINVSFLDGPNSTSALTYSFQWKTTSGITIYLNRAGTDSNNSGYHRGASNIVLLEVGT